MTFWRENALRVVFLANNLYTGPVDRVACVTGVFSRLLMFI